MKNKKYVVLEHLLLPQRGFRFWSTNSGDNTKLIDGTVAYKEVLFTDSASEALEFSQKPNSKAIATFNELYEHNYKNSK